MRSTAPVEVAVPCDAELGEGPAWDSARGELLWCDIPRGLLHRCSPAAGSAVSTVAFGEPVSAVLPRAGGGLAVLVAGGVALLDAGGARERLVPVPGDRPGNRLADAGVDPLGRLWFGTMDPAMAGGTGAVHVLAGEGPPRPVVPGTRIANGIGFAPDASTLYLVDSALGGVDAFDLDLGAGTLHRRRPWVRVPAADGVPDGLAVDAEGGVWVALWRGAALHRYDPAGRLDAVVPLPVRQVTSCAFGGPDLRTLFVTTGRVEMDAAALADEPLAGSVLAVVPGVAGLPVPLVGGRE